MGYSVSVKRTKISPYIPFVRVWLDFLYYAKFNKVEKISHFNDM